MPSATQWLKRELDRIRHEERKFPGRIHAPEHRQLKAELEEALISQEKLEREKLERERLERERVERERDIDKTGAEAILEEVEGFSVHTHMPLVERIARREGLTLTKTVRIFVDGAKTLTDEIDA